MGNKTIAECGIRNKSQTGGWFILLLPPCFPMRLVLITGLVLAATLSPSAGQRSDGLRPPAQTAPVPAPAYFPPPDRDGGWRTATTAQEARQAAGMDLRRLDEAYETARQSTKNGGLLIVRNGWLVYERYFGLARRESTPNLASIGKSFTSIAVGILVAERPDRLPDGLDQKVFTPELMPSVAFPLADPAMADIKLGQLLAFTAGIRGNNPCYGERDRHVAVRVPASPRRSVARAPGRAGRACPSLLPHLSLQPALPL